MVVRLLSIASLAACGTFAFLAPASATPLDFVDMPQQVRLTLDDENGTLAPYSSVGEIWREGGFEVRYDSYTQGAVPARRHLSDHAYLVNSGCCDESYGFLEITRPDGDTFNYEGFEVSSFGTSNEILLGSFYPEPGTSYSAEFLRFPMVGDDLRLTGERADGTTVVVDASTQLDVSAPYSVRAIEHRGELRFQGHSSVPGPHSLLLNTAEMASLTDLVSLRFTTDADRSDIWERSLPFMDFSPLITAGLEACGFAQSGRSYANCTIDGVGEFNFEVTSELGPNYRVAVTPDAINLSLNGPAAVPLPAGGWLLLTAGGLLVGLRRRKTRASTAA